jgi:DNA-binding transcriptional regulator YbjK
VTERRTHLLDAAIDLVGREGMRGLTHRAVDATAGVPPGSTSNHFRTREALLLGVVDRFVALEREMAEGPRGEVEPTAAGVARALGEFCRAATGPGRVVTLARYAILVEVAQRPELASVLTAGADRVDTWALDLITRAGSPDPVRDEGILANYATGLVLHQLSLPAPDFDPAPRIASLIDTMDWRPS